MFENITQVNLIIKTTKVEQLKNTAKALDIINLGYFC